MSTLIRCLDNEMQGAKTMEMRNGAGGSANKKQTNDYKMPRTKKQDYDNDDDDNERLDTLGGDDDNYQGNFFDNDNEKENDEEEEIENVFHEENLIEVDLEKLRDDEEMDIEKRFNVYFFNLEK